MLKFDRQQKVDSVNGALELRPRIEKVVDEFTAQGYRILPLRASHSPKTSPVVYVIEKDAVSFGYFHDLSASRSCS